MNSIQHGPDYPAGSVTGPVVHAVQMAYADEQEEVIGSASKAGCWLLLAGLLGVHRRGGGERCRPGVTKDHHLARLAYTTAEAREASAPAPAGAG